MKKTILFIMLIVCMQYINTEHVNAQQWYGGALIGLDENGMTIADAYYSCEGVEDCAIKSCLLYEDPRVVYIGMVPGWDSDQNCSISS